MTLIFLFGTSFIFQAIIFYSLHFLVYTLTGKPNSVHDSADGEEDGTYRLKIHCNCYYVRRLIAALIGDCKRKLVSGVSTGKTKAQYANKLVEGRL